MGEPLEQHTGEIDGWPLPSPEVLRELEAPQLEWSEPEWPVSLPTRRSARD